MRHMGRLTADLLARFHEWERSAQVALILAAVLFVVVLALAAVGPANTRQPALIGLFGLIVMMQVIVMWANRGMVTTYTQAQRAYLAEDFATARDLLEELRAADTADWRDLTLLGNTYRQLGQLAESKQVLLEALDKQPDHHFPLYGFGRTLLAEGTYKQAAEVLQSALTAGAPAVVRVDLAEALFRNKQFTEARDALLADSQLDIGSYHEPHRALLHVFLLYQLDNGQAPTAQLIQSGLPFWQAQAARFQATPYGQALVSDLQTLQTLQQRLEA